MGQLASILFNISGNSDTSVDTGLVSIEDMMYCLIFDPKFVSLILTEETENR